MSKKSCLRVRTIDNKIFGPKILRFECKFHSTEKCVNKMYSTQL